MKLSVITPVGPGHVEWVHNAQRSVFQAELGLFTEITHVVVNDDKGALGRSKARNLGMADADWYFFLDADDTMALDACLYNDFNRQATFGTVNYNGRKVVNDRFPCTREDIIEFGPRGSLCMGFFIRARVAQDLQFNERLDIGEDFDFYMRIPDWIKVDHPLAHIGRHIPSATGPRSSPHDDWLYACESVVKSYNGSGNDK